MFSKVVTAAVNGIEGKTVTVEVDIGRGLPIFNVVGLGDTAVKEAGQRVKSALVNSGFNYPTHRITVNLVPAYLHKKGSHYDLAIAVGILSAMGEIITDGSIELNRCGFIGELQLDGKLSPVRGILPMVKALAESTGNIGNIGNIGNTGNKEVNDEKIRFIFIPVDNFEEGLLAEEAFNVKIIPVSALNEVAEILKGEKSFADTFHKAKAEKVVSDRSKEADDISIFGEAVWASDFGDVKGQWAVKEAIAAAVCGNHGLLMIGPPGSGKTMLAKRIPTILPKMTAKEQLETTMVYSVAGLLGERTSPVRQRPFRMVDYRITKAGLLGGGITPYPGEVSLAHNGVLFIDEFLEMERSQLEMLRKPVEEKEVKLIRNGNLYTYPAGFMLVGAANPCKCGFFGDENHVCTCTQTQIDQYKGRLSGPVADRIDMFIEVRPIDYETLHQDESGTSEKLREKVLFGRERQRDRFKGAEISFNSQMEERHIKEFCVLADDAEELMKNIFNRYHISTRRYFKILRVARTVADIEGSEIISLAHIAAAFQYTIYFDRGEKL